MTLRPPSSCGASFCTCSQRLRTHPSLRVPCQSLSVFPLGTIPQLLSSSSSTLLRLEPAKLRRRVLLSALPTLRRSDRRDSETYGCGIIYMHILRFFVAHPTIDLRMCSGTRTRVFASSPLPLKQLSASALTHLAHRSAIPTTFPPASPVSPCSIRSRLPLKSHSAPRPPQTPAASS